MQNSPRESFAEIDLEAFKWNFKQIQDYVQPAGIGAVVKANAYGHGVETIAQEAVRLGAAYLCVGFVQEGLAIRRLGLDIPVLILIPVLIGEIERALCENIALTVSSFTSAQEISEVAKRLGEKAKVHVKIDTGMHRIGLLWERAVDELIKINALSGITIQGVYTHFAAAESTDLTYSYTQLERFKAVMSKLPFSVSIVHCANSAAILQVTDSFFNMVRPGLALYGYYPSKECKRPLALKPVMSIKSYVSEVRKICAPDGIGYSLTYKVREPTKIATVPIGYADGVNRLFSNSGSVLIRGIRFPIVGLVSMDLVMLDLGSESDIQPGDEVVLLGKQRDGEISIDEWCEKLQTIPYEITCNIPSRIPRRLACRPRNATEKHGM